MSYKILNTSEFQKEIKHLSKKYPSLHNDFEVFLKQLSENPFQGTPLGKNFYDKSEKSTITGKEINERLKRFSA